MFLGTGSFIARLFGRFTNTIDAPTAPALAGLNPKGTNGAGSGFDMSKLARASSSFTNVKTSTNNGSKFDMSKLAASAQSSTKTCNKTCSKEHCSCEATPFDTASLTDELIEGDAATATETDTHLETEVNDFNIAVATNDAGQVAGAEAPVDVVVAVEDTIIEEAAISTDGSGAQELGDILTSIDRHAEIATGSTPTRGLAARLKVVATMNGPKALRAKKTTRRSTLARPAPVKRALEIRKLRDINQVTWPAFTGRTATLAQPSRELVTVTSQVIALREKAKFAKPRTTASGAPMRPTLRAA